MDRQTGEAVVARVNRAYPQLLQTNTPASCGEFIQRVAGEPECVAERVGLLSKSPAETGYTFPNGVRCALDVIAWPDGRRTDIIQSSGAVTTPGGPSWQVIPPEQWRPSNVWVDVSGWPIFDSGAVPKPSGPLTVGFGWFCWMRAWADWAPEAQINLDWILPEINPTIFRTFLSLNGAPYWRDAGVKIDATWEDRYKRMLDQVGALGLFVRPTIYAGIDQTPTPDSRRRFHDRIIAASEGRWAAIAGWECVNEWESNGWTAEQVKEVGRDFSSKLPKPYRMALSSPSLAHGYVLDGGTWRPPTNEEMQRSFDELYGDADHAGANDITVHVMRDKGKWSDPFAFNFLYPSLPKINNEPPGPGTSAGGEHTTGADVEKQLTQTQNAGWPIYIGHSEWCPWNGHLPVDYWNGYREVKFVKDLPDMPACAAAMKSFSSGDPPHPHPQPKSQLLSGQALKVNEQLVTEGFQALYQPDGNFVIYTAEGDPVWASQTAGREPGSVQMNPDGNLVIYDASGTPVWASQTAGNPGAMAQLQPDGKLVIYADPNGPQAGTPLWASA